MRIFTRYILREVLSHALLGGALFTFVLFMRDLGKILELVFDLWAITVVASLAGSFGAFFHARSKEMNEEMEKAEALLKRGVPGERRVRPAGEAGGATPPGR